MAELDFSIYPTGMSLTTRLPIILMLNMVQKLEAHACAEGMFLYTLSVKRVLMPRKPVFDVEATRHSKTVIIAHVSPHLADASHSNVCHSF
jgi:kinesin family protein 2/24